MTEEEAKTKACCGSGHRPLDNGLCIGSECMAWRVATTAAFQENVYNRTAAPEGDGWKPSTTRPDNHAWWRTIPERHDGYCGLAGSPS